MIQALLTYSDDQGLDLDCYNTEGEALFAIREKIRVDFERTQTEIPDDLDEMGEHALSNLLSDEDSGLQFSLIPLFGPSQLLQHGTFAMFSAEGLALAN